MVYKGRRKKTIDYFAIKSVDKALKPRVLQEVRFSFFLFFLSLLSLSIFSFFFFASPPLSARIKCARARGRRREGFAGPARGGRSALRPEALQRASGRRGVPETRRVWAVEEAREQWKQ